MTDLLLDIHQLKVGFHSAKGTVQAVRGVDLQVKRGETLAIVGESGCGKSTLAKALIRQNQAPFTPQKTCIEGRAQLFSGKNHDLINATSSQMRNIRAHHIAMISQDALSGLNPVLSIGYQLGEAFVCNYPELSRAGRNDKIFSILDEVGLPEPENMARRFPHQLSGGQRQRVMIAMAVARQPDLIIADEPTTALDVSVQARILRLLKAEQQKTGAAIIFITHDLGVVARIADRVAVMYAGQIVETATVRDFLLAPRHPYTAGLLASVPGHKSDYPRLTGYAPEPRSVTTGCAFRPRCLRACDNCTIMPPATGQSSHHVYCWNTVQ